VREKVDPIGGGRVSCALVFDRELSREEIARFYLVESGERPAPMDFDVAGRVVAWECRREDEARWRLAIEIFLVKSFRAEAAAQNGAGARPRPTSRPAER
jgi:hypothetical protein